MNLQTQISPVILMDFSEKMLDFEVVDKNEGGSAASEYEEPVKKMK